MLLLLRNITLFTCLFLSLEGIAQEEKTRSLSASTITNLSFTGYQQSLCIDIGINEMHHLYAGPAFSLSDAYMPWRSSYGFHSGYRAEFSLQGNWISSAGLHLQGIFGEQHRVNKTNSTWEGFLNYGFGYQYKKLSIMNNLGFGGYIERFFNSFTNEYRVQNGYNFMVSLQIRYQL